MEAKDRIIFPLDYSDRADAFRAAMNVWNKAGINHFKLGLEAIHNGWGHTLAGDLATSGYTVGYDAKLNDIPNTVAGAAKGIARLGVKWFNIMGCAGPDAISAAVEKRGESDIFVVTVLTSMDEEKCQDALGGTVEKKVLQYAKWAKECGAQGVICSPRELTIVRADPELASLQIITPGVRPTWAPANDQKRVMGPGAAIRMGADFVVIGRPISQPPAEVGSPENAVKLLAEEIEGALAQKEGR